MLSEYLVLGISIFPALLP